MHVYCERIVVYYAQLCWTNPSSPKQLRIFYFLSLLNCFLRWWKWATHWCFILLFFCLLLSGATYFMSCMLHPVFVLPTPPSPPTQTHTIHVWICLLCCCCCLPEFSLSFPSVEWTIGIKKCPQNKSIK